MNRPPSRTVRLNIGAMLLDGLPRTAEEISSGLAGFYPGERHLCTEAVELHLQALRAVGVVMLADPADDEARQDLTYVLSADGKARVQRNLE
ncbi:hypothetical protein [Desulfovibrio falkowii]|uniref:Transcriptional regulator n=1 Tax=Desulfovibrio desulfuricans (strain ATCC 27774 / DSM 6949 / MB) TaxID=525146 RepID=B8J4W4_DESDA|nr:hypothetical protein [uncultured Desulfovibrio sp.]